MRNTSFTDNATPKLIGAVINADRTEEYNLEIQLRDGINVGCTISGIHIIKHLLNFFILKYLPSITDVSCLLKSIK